jgi:hypothetical protein
MTWHEVRSTYPDRWLLIEALLAKSQQDQRLLEDVAVLGQFLDSREAFKSYQTLHKAHREREYYVVHTSNESLAIREVQWLGIRGAM